ncbi:MAG: peptidoglycan DD-metalloendopeptidase family protein [Thermodesulfobacteriota bacterium]|nr:peptidoglycan DD-metalloendopeptidase family protein [Thermodesulfobacteriota bacterium]
MGKEYFDILIFGHKTSKANHLRIYRKTFKIGFYLIGLVYLCTTFFFCDYIQIRRKVYELIRLRQELYAQKSHIQFFSDRIENLETELSEMRDFDRKIRIISNLEKGQETRLIMGIGGPSPSDIREKLKREGDDKGLIQQMRSDIERLKSEAISREESLSELEKLLQSRKEMLAHTPSIWPVMGWVTSGFGFRIDTFTGLNQMHEGIDISNRVGASVIAPADGVISDIRNDLGLGKILVISHGFGMITRYAHLNKVLASVGQKVKRGEKIAEVGTSGRTTGPHLHYEVRINGIPVNPMRYILN